MHLVNLSRTKKLSPYFASCDFGLISMQFTNRVELGLVLPTPESERAFFGLLSPVRILFSRVKFLFQHSPLFFRIRILVPVD